MIDSSNMFAVGERRETIVVVGLARRDPTVNFGPAELSHDEAVNLAAWLLAVAAPPQEEFERLVNIILNT